MENQQSSLFRRQCSLDLSKDIPFYPSFKSQTGARDFEKLSRDSSMGSASRPVFHEELSGILSRVRVKINKDVETLTLMASTKSRRLLSFYLGSFEMM